MKNPEEYRKYLNKKQTELRQLLKKSNHHLAAIEALLQQHASLHSSQVGTSEFGSYADMILKDLTETQYREIPQNRTHSIVWTVWHMARIEDVTMSILVADASQVLHRNSWAGRMNVVEQDTGNAMTAEDIARISRAIDIETLQRYRVEVGKNTREIIKGLSADDFHKKVGFDRLQKIMDTKAVSDESKGLLDYWGNRDVAGLMLMPATRHNLVHLNEAGQIRKRLLRRK